MVDRTVMELMMSREKQGRVESGEERRQEERKTQENSNLRLQELSQLTQIFLQAKTVLEAAVGRKTIFSDFLESVVAREQGQYREVCGLMNRCQGLVISRSPSNTLNSNQETLFQG